MRSLGLGRQTALLVLLTRPARARIVAPDLRTGPYNLPHRREVMMVVVTAVRPMHVAVLLPVIMRVRVAVRVVVLWPMIAIGAMHMRRGGGLTVGLVAGHRGRPWQGRSPELLSDRNDDTSRRPHPPSAPQSRQHFLYFLPDPQWQGSLRPSLGDARTTGRLV